MDFDRSFDGLLRHITPGKRLLIQTHDFPDFDAIAAGFGLLKLFETYGLNATIIYGAEIQGYSLGEALKSLNIPVTRMRDFQASEDDEIILVDSAPGNKNVTALPGKVIGVIDHHPSFVPQTCEFWDVRDKYGSCSSLVYEYYEMAGFQPEKNVATALLMGIMMDTGFFTRGVSQQDLNAFNALYFKGNWVMGAYLVKNSLSVQDVPVFQEALTNLRVYKGFGFTFLSRESSADTIALIADDYLRFHEVFFMVVAGLNQGEIKISVRSEDPMMGASVVARTALEGIGYGGGHVHMGGGTVSLKNFTGPDDLYQRFKKAIDYHVHRLTGDFKA